MGLNNDNYSREKLFMKDGGEAEIPEKYEDPKWCRKVICL